MVADNVRRPFLGVPGSPQLTTASEEMYSVSQSPLVQHLYVLYGMCVWQGQRKVLCGVDACSTQVQECGYNTEQQECEYSTEVQECGYNTEQQECEYSTEQQECEYSTEVE